MNDPIRYTGKTEGSVLGSPHWEHPEGEWVKYEDYEKLKAQIKRMAMDSIHDLNHIGGLQEENARLKAEVERLTNENDNNSIMKEEWYHKCLSARAEVERLKAELADEKSANASVEGRQNSANRGLSMRNHLLRAEIERLRKAGDFMAECLIEQSYEYPTKAWTAAKEGKPSV